MFLGRKAHKLRHQTHHTGVRACTKFIYYTHSNSITCTAQNCTLSHRITWVYNIKHKKTDKICLFYLKKSGKKPEMSTRKSDSKSDTSDLNIRCFTYDVKWPQLTNKKKFVEKDEVFGEKSGFVFFLSSFLPFSVHSIKKRSLYKTWLKKISFS